MTFRMIVQLWNTKYPKVSRDADLTENYIYAYFNEAWNGS